MAVDKENPEYTSRAIDWRLVSDFIAGERAVKAAGQNYLPRLGGHDDTQYAAYKTRTPFFGATSRTREGLSGAIFRKPPIVTVPARLDKFITNVDRGGMHIETFARFLVDAVLALGRYGILVDVPTTGGDPYFAGYDAASIINWRVEKREGEPVLVMVVLREYFQTAKPDDEFDTASELRYRVLRLDDTGYSQQVYIKATAAAGGGASFVAQDEPVYVQQLGRRMKRIPFTVVGPNKIGFADTPPPLLDVASMNKVHYTLAADWRHGLHFTGLPTPWASGVQKGSILPMGSETAWLLPEGGQAGMLEFTGQGLTAMENALSRVEKLMAVLGARLLEDQKAAAEAADTVRMRHSGENSVLAAVADNCGAGLTMALEDAMAFMPNVKGDVEVTLNTDFFDAPMAAAELTAMVSAWTAGAIPRSVLWHNLREGERIPEDMDDAALLAEIEAEGPVGMSNLGEDMGEDDPDPPKNPPDPANT